MEGRAGGRRRRLIVRPWVIALVTCSVVAACGSDIPDQVLTRAPSERRAATTTTPAPAPAPAPATTTSVLATTTSPTSGSSPSGSSTTDPALGTGPPGPVGSPPSPAGDAGSLEVTEVARGLDTVWAMAFDPEGTLWFTERGGQLTRLGEPPREVAGVVEGGEGGLMGLEIDGQGQVFVMYTGATDNRVVRLEPDGSQRVLVDGIAKAGIHNGGRLRFGADGSLYAATGDASIPELAQDPGSRNGKVLRLDPDGDGVEVFSSGHRNVQGLCITGDGRLLATEHGPDRGDEVNVLSAGFNGGWPASVGTGIQNYTPTIAPAGCAVYSSDLIPGWQGSLLFVTLKGNDLRRLTLGPGGQVTGEEVLFDGEFGRLRAVAVAPDGSVYLATSNRDGRGSPAAGDDRILRLAPG